MNYKKICSAVVISICLISVWYGGKIWTEEPATKATSIKEESKKKESLLPEPLVGETLIVLDKEIPIPKISFKAADAKDKSLDNYRGQVVLLHFWATEDCDSCVAELPALDRLQSAFKNDPFKVIAVAVDSEEAKEIKDFYEKYQINHLSAFVDSSYTPEAIPISYLIDKNGKIVASVGGPSVWKQAKNLNMIRKYLGQ